MDARKRNALTGGAVGAVTGLSVGLMSGLTSSLLERVVISCGLGFVAGFLVNIVLLKKYPE